MRNDVYKPAKADQHLRRSLLLLFKSWKSRPSRPGELAKEIIHRIKGYEYSNNIYKDMPSVSAHIEKIDDYINSLKNTRKTFLALPEFSRGFLHEFIDGESYNLPREVISTLTSETYNDKSKFSTQRKIGISHLESWTPELELIDLMKESAQRMREHISENIKRRDSRHIGLIASIAEFCTEHNLAVSIATRSHFLQILRLVFPDLKDPRAAIEEALQILSKRPK